MYERVCQKGQACWLLNTLAGQSVADALLMNYLNKRLDASYPTGMLGGGVGVGVCVRACVLGHLQCPLCKCMDKQISTCTPGQKRKSKKISSVWNWKKHSVFHKQANKQV